MFASVLLTAFFQIHGSVLSTLRDGSSIVAIAPVTRTLAGGSYRVRIAPPHDFPAGTGIDGYMQRGARPWHITDANAAGAFVAGMPDQGRVIPIDIGSTLPPTRMLDPAGQFVRLNAFDHQTVILSFVFTRCTDICPIISAKFEQLQRLIDPKRMHLIEISLDPDYDSPKVLARYAARFHARPATWSLLTAKGSTIAHLLNRFGVSSLQTASDAFEHSDRLYIVAPNGRVAEDITTSGWNASDVAAEAASISGMAANPLERFRLSLIASLVSFCGGSRYAGVVLLDIALITLIAIAVTWILIRLGLLLKRNG